ncbi:hypothetical protein QTG54_009249 [Skeletonema marinoi]|uniref:Uncharacterized protein n=1 Tax=Skeletonema marinoi TaxID=267567 RepID=A0AAD8Y783_9STRA|nr:hypothetical protein QTG54_009249 [Skeletonema marinoi]
MQKVLHIMCRCNGGSSRDFNSDDAVNGSAVTSTSTCSRTITISRPTFPEDRPKKSIDTANLNTKDIESLKKSDPFLYFSIPAVHKAAIHSRQIDLPALHADSHSCRVERRSRISFECHTDLLMEEFMEELSGLSNLNGALDDDLDAILGSLTLMTNKEEQRW